MNRQFADIKLVLVSVMREKKIFKGAKFRYFYRCYAL